MIGLAIGPVMNLLWGVKARHYALSILAAVVGGAASTRQDLVHIAGPNDPGYGPAVLGWHLYTWAFATFLIAVAGCAILLLWNRPLELSDQGVLHDRARSPKWLPFVAIWAIMWVFLDLVIIGISVIPECGLGLCPDNPPDGVSAGNIGGWVLVLGVGAVAAAVAYSIDRRLPKTDRELLSQ
jgi:hypothetical protein